MNKGLPLGFAMRNSDRNSWSSDGFATGIMIEILEEFHGHLISLPPEF